MKRIFWIRAERTYDLDVGEEHLGWPALQRATDEDRPAQQQHRPSIRSRIARLLRR